MTDVPKVLTIGERPRDTRVTVGVDGSLTLTDRYGRDPIILDFDRIEAHTAFVAEVIAALEWRVANYIDELKAELEAS